MTPDTTEAQILTLSERVLTLANEGTRSTDKGIALPKGVTTEKLATPPGPKILTPGPKEPIPDKLLLPHDNQTLIPEPEKTKPLSTELKMLVAPYAFLQEVANSVGIDIWDEAFKQLAKDEKEILNYQKIHKLLLSDDEQKIKQGLELTLEINEKNRLDWLKWISQSTNSDVINIVRSFLNRHYIQLPKSTTTVNRPSVPNPTPEYLIAYKSPNKKEDVAQILKTDSKQLNYGKRGGQINKTEPSAFELFFEKVISQIEIENLDWQTWVARLTRLVDITHYQGEILKIPSLRAIDTIIETIEKHSSSLQSLESTWNLLSRFDIPYSEELASSILELMDKHQDFNHPLAPMLLGRLSQEHPFIQKQQKRIDELIQQCKIKPTELLKDDVYKKIEQMQKKIVSIYPNTKPTDTFGFDWEVETKVIGIPLPKGVEMGVDGGLNIPELRLLPKKEVLEYNNEWRKRMFDLWLWQQTAKVISPSIHFHVSKNTEDIKKQKQEVLMKLFFGLDSNDLTTNSEYETFEVRIALEGYPIQKREKAFTNGANCGPFADFILSLKTAQVNPDLLKQQVDTTEISNSIHSRLIEIFSSITNPQTRAAAAIALHRNLGLRIKTSLKAVDDNLFIYALPETERLGFVKEMLEKTRYNSSIVNKVLRQLSALPETERLGFVKEMLQQSEYDDDNIYLAIEQLSALPETERLGFVKEMLEKTRYNSSIVNKVLRQLSALPETNEKQLLLILLIKKSNNCLNYSLTKKIKKNWIIV